MKFLIVVDMQNDFIDGALAVDGAKEIIPRINEMICSGEYDRVIFTRDWHPLDHYSFDTWPAHCIANERGSEIHPDLVVELGNLIINKGMDRDIESFSAFLDEYSNSTGLYGYIFGLMEGKPEEQSTVHIVGVATDYCVRFTAIDSAKAFPTFVHLDACADVSLQPEDLDEALDEMRSWGVKIIGEKGEW